MVYHSLALMNDGILLFIAKALCLLCLYLQQCLLSLFWLLVLTIKLLQGSRTVTWTHVYLELSGQVP